MRLTTRNKKVILLLLQEVDYITVSFIADKINVSPRTILRELKGIENWLTHKGVVVERKKGAGIRLYIKKDERESIREYIENMELDTDYSPEQRLTLLKIELLKGPEITKLYTLTKLLDVTEGTISADLDKLETWMNKFKLKINKRPGLGVFIEGEEMATRSAIISLIYEQFHEAELVNIIFTKDKDKLNLELIRSKTGESILSIIDIDSLKLAQELLSNIEKEMDYLIVDNSYITLFIRISVTISRCKKGLFIDKTEDQNIIETKDKLYNIVEDWFKYGDYISDRLVLVKEIRNIVIHIRGAETHEKYEDNNENLIEDAKIIELTKQVIYIAEKETGTYLEDNKKLLKGLSRHLKVAIYRIKMNLDIMNPLLEDIKEMYTDLFNIAQKCGRYIEQSENITMPEDEIAYIATYIGAAVKEEKNNSFRIYKVVVVCTNDIGAVQLLVSEIEHDFPNIQVMSVVSVMDLDIANLLQDSIDLIIATVELHPYSITTVLVNSILNQEDKMRITRVLEELSPEDKNLGKVRTLQLEEKVLRIKQYCDYILQICHNLFLIDKVGVDSRDEVFRFIGHAIEGSEKNKLALEEDLKKSKAKGSTILNPKGIILYQCSSKVIKELSMTVIRTKDLISTISKEGDYVSANTFIILLSPDSIDNCGLELINEITKKIINSDFSTTLKTGGKEDVIIEVNTILDLFLQTKTKQLVSYTN